MARRAVQFVLDSNVLSWARISAGWTLEEAAQKLKVNPETVKAWEAGAAAISLSKLENLANYYKRPLAVFFLPQPPQTSPPPTDFRFLPNRQGEFSKETHLALRRARRLQAIASELMQALEQQSHPFVGQATTNDAPEETALQERRHLEVDVARQSAWKDAREALRNWRGLLEKVKILTFQMQMPVKDTRGFSLAEKGPPVVVISSEDSVHARIFTLLHEYGHIILRSSGICLPREEALSGQQNKTEPWCDHFAGAFLMPKPDLATDEDCQAFLKNASDKARRLSRLSQKYKVSRLALLTRLFVLGWLTYERYTREVESAAPPTGKRGGGFVSPAKRCITEKGITFTSLVLQAGDQDIVSYSEMADYLGLRVKHVEKIRRLLAV